MAFVGWPLRLVARTAKWLETTAHQVGEWTSRAFRSRIGGSGCGLRWWAREWLWLWLCRCGSVACGYGCGSWVEVLDVHGVWTLRTILWCLLVTNPPRHQCVVSAPTSSTCTALRSGYQAWTTSTPAPSVDKSGGDDLGWSTASLGHRGARNFALCVCVRAYGRLSPAAVTVIVARCSPCLSKSTLRDSARTLQVQWRPKPVQQTVSPVAKWVVRGHHETATRSPHHHEPARSGLPEPAACQQRQPWHVRCQPWASQLHHPHLRLHLYPNPSQRLGRCPPAR